MTRAGLFYILDEFWKVLKFENYYELYLQICTVPNTVRRKMLQGAVFEKDICDNKVNVVIDKDTFTMLLV